MRLESVTSRKTSGSNKWNIAFSIKLPAEVSRRRAISLFPGAIKTDQMVFYLSRGTSETAKLCHGRYHQNQPRSDTDAVRGGDC